MASPWINKGTVIHAPPQVSPLIHASRLFLTRSPFLIGLPKAHYEHSSVPATLKKLFNLPHFLTHRDAWAATFDHVVNQRYL
jgi:phospholipase C